MKKRFLVYPILVVVLFPVFISLELSVFGGILAGMLVSVPIYFFCFVLKLPVWLWSKRKPLSKGVKEARAEALETARQIETEGIVLLKNACNTLPLKNENQKKINVFGRCSLQMFYNGSGSAASDLSKCISMPHALREFGGFQLNEDLLNLQMNYLNKKQISIKKNKNQNAGVIKINKGGAEFLGKRPELRLEEFPTELFLNDSLYEDGKNILEHASVFSEYAMVVLGRGGAEGFELKAEDLKVHEKEHQLLKAVCTYFEKVILVLNTANPLEMGFLSDYPQICSVLWIGMPGSMGNAALASILCGKETPSGRLADTWQKDSFAALACNNFQLLNKDGTWNEKSWHLDNCKKGTGYFLHYSEGIYVGYRYFETRCRTDVQYDYDSEVMWPFGYGLSYTTFAQTITEFGKTEDCVLLNVCVKNTGEHPGKEVVQVYIKPPYSGRIEKSAVQLAAFHKTSVLKPGEEETHLFRIPLEEIASFDVNTEGAYVLEKGNYEISIMKNAHEEIESKKWEQERKIVYLENKDGKRKSDFLEAHVRFEDAKTKGMDATREWDQNSPAFKGPDDGCYHAGEDVIRALDKKVLSDEEAGFTMADLPKTGMRLSKKIRFKDMRGIPYDDKRWDEFISQLKIGEMCNLCGNGAWHIEKIKRLGIPKRLMPDGSTCICSTVFSGIVMGNAGEGITYPNPVVVASTWNTQMAYFMGASAGKEAKNLGYHGWYAPAVNCHRTPFNARNFEYYSEDAILSGKMAAAVVSGAGKEGILCFIKHFAMNERESAGRNQLLTYCNEQAMREIYLKPFEIAVKEGGAKGIMTSFNYIGNEWAGANEALLSHVLREEWGFEGVVSTDACVYPHMDVKKMLVAGGDLVLDSLGGFVGGNVKRAELLKAAKSKKTRIIMTKNLQRASKNILYAFRDTY